MRKWVKRFVKLQSWIYRSENSVYKKHRFTHCFPFLFIFILSWSHRALNFCPFIFCVENFMNIDKNKTKSQYRLYSSSWTESSTSWGRRTPTWWLGRRGSLWWSLPRWSEWEPRKPPLSISQTSANCEPRVAFYIYWQTHFSDTCSMCNPQTDFFFFFFHAINHRLHRQPKHLLAFLLAELGTRYAFCILSDASSQAKFVARFVFVCSL